MHVHTEIVYTHRHTHIYIYILYSFFSVKYPIPINHTLDCVIQLSNVHLDQL